MTGEKKFNGSSLFWALLGGAVIGAGIGILTAPEKGEETRRRLGNWFDKNYKKGKDTLVHKSEQVTEAVKAGREAYANHREKVSA